MADSPSHTITARQYRLASGVLTIGSMAVGLLLLDRLIGHYVDTINQFYGGDIAERMSPGSGMLGSLTVGQWLIAAVSLFGIIFFVRGERKRAAGIRGHRRSVASDGRIQVLARPGRQHLFDTFIRRTSMFAGVMLFCWVLEASYSRYVAGLGWGLGFETFAASLSIASIFGLCVVVGLFVAAVSMFGIRVLASLQAALQRIGRTVTRYLQPARPNERASTFRELFGVDILSRPPPVAVRV